MASRAAVQAQALVRRLTVAWLLAALALLQVLIAGLLYPHQPSSLIRLVVLVSLLAGIYALFMAVRVLIDRRIFAVWAARWQQDDSRKMADMAALDAWLVRHLLQAGGKRPLRSLTARIRGTLGLQRHLLAASLIQSLCLQLMLLAG